LSEQLVIPEVDPEELLLERANELFAWFQQPSEDIPELSETARYRFEQLAGDADLLDVVGCIQGLEDDERLAVQLTISGFDQTLIKELVDEEALKLAIKKVRVLFNPHTAPAKSPEKPAVVPKKTVARTPRAPRTPAAARDKSPESSERGVGDLFGLYLNQIGRIALLDAATEVELAKTIEAGLFAEQILLGAATDVEATREELEFLVEEGKAAKLRFIESNSRLSVSIAKKYYYYNTDISDRSQIGMEGIIRAVEKFDYTKGYKFSTYATWWVRQAITRGEADTGLTIRLPVHMVEKLKAVRKLRSDMFKVLDEYPTDEELSKELGFDVAAFQESVKVATGSVSLNDLLDSGDAEFGDIVGVYHEPGYEVVDESIYSDEFRAAVEAAGLTEREEQVILMRYGLTGSEGAMTLDDIGDVFGVSRERIRQILKKVEDKLREDPTFLALAQDMNFKPDGAAKTTKTEKPLGVRERAKFELAARLAENDTVLTEMEHYVSRAVIEEKNQADAAKRLKLSAPTVAKVMRGVRAKLNLQ